MTTTRLADVHAMLGDEHRVLIALIRRIQAEDEHETLVALLDELHRSLIGHFSKEQFPGGLYECLGAYGEHHHPVLKTLIEDHCSLLSAARALLEKARAGTRGPALRREIDAVIERLLDHERREHALADSLLSAEPD